MKTINCKEAPIKVFGIPFFYEKKNFTRLPDRLCNILAGSGCGRRCPGARIGFRTNAKTFTVKTKLKTLSVDVGMSIYACQSIAVMIGDRSDPVFAGLASPPDYNTKVFEHTFEKSSEMEEVTLWLLRNEEIEDIELTFPDDALIEEPTPYKYGPALFYGSSVTEGGCCSSITNNYPALLSRWLDMDIYNFGFSGSAKGEPEIADYINTIDFSLFVLDYDHNAPDDEHLQRTHEPFFRKIREKHPDMPIIILARPNFGNWEDSEAHRNIIKQTYENAVAAGDKNVYYIDPKEFYGDEDSRLCTVDRIHPNDLGFYRMAKAIYPVMKNILTK